MNLGHNSFFYRILYPNHSLISHLPISNGQVRVLTLERDALKQDNEKWESAFSESTQPQRMVLESLRKKQEEVSDAKDETEQLRETLLKVTQQNEQLRQERAAMEADMETILKQRADLQKQVTRAVQ